MNVKFIWFLVVMSTILRPFPADAMTSHIHPTRHPLHHCMTNSECHGEHICCSYTALLGRRNIKKRSATIPADGMVHYCLPYKNGNATWCDLKMQYSPDTPYYIGLCPCGPGLRCTHTEELDPKWYPRDRYGKCTEVVA